MKDAAKVVPQKRGGVKDFIISRRINRNWQLYAMLIPVIAFFAVFCYAPMYGITLAFKDYKVLKGIMGSPWASPWYKYFLQFFNSPYFTRVVSNTIIVSLESLLLGFPLPIILALSINEVQSTKYKKFVQNITYAPHFLSTLVLVGLIRAFCNSDYGIVNIVIRKLGGEGYNWIQKANLFRPLYIGSGIWQNIGWDSIIYIAALAGIDPQLHEAAMMDGANRLQRIWHINLPGIRGTIILLLILDCGKIMSVGFEKAYLLQNALNLPQSEIISTYVYKTGVIGTKFSYTSAIGLFNSIINVILLLITNRISSKVSGTSLF